MKHTLLHTIRIGDTIQPDLNHQISYNSRFDKIIILGIILFLINMTFVPYKGLDIVKVNSKNEMNDHVKNQVQANTLSHEFNTNNPKESKTLIAIDTRDKNIKKLDHKKLVHKKAEILKPDKQSKRESIKPP